MKEYLQRSRPAKGVIEVGRRPTLVFVTVCTSARSRSLADTRVHSVLKEVWLSANYWEVGIYALMPDHLHFLAWPGRVEFDLDGWIQYWKSLATKKLGRVEYGWQRCSFHHTIRSFESAEEKAAYILQNPVRRGLVEKPEDWPFQGEIFRAERWW
jgi:REP element-mobilizing transposase RayT